jgi:hypothetical protein
MTFTSVTCNINHVTIILKIVKSDATIWSVTLESSITLLEVSFLLLEASFIVFIIQVSLTIAICDHKVLIVKATGLYLGANALAFCL